MIRVLICDASEESRRALRDVLSLRSDIEIVGEAADGRDAISFAEALSPDVALIDPSLPVFDGPAVTRRIRELVPCARIVALAGLDDKAQLTAMIEAGAGDYCLKGAPLWELERAIVGASDPLVRLAHGLARWVSRAGLGEFVARELVDLTGATFAATYLAGPEGHLSLGGAAGTDMPAPLGIVPEIALDAFAQRARMRRTGAESELGSPDSETVAVPLVTDGEALGAIVLLFPAELADVAKGELLADVADLIAASIASEQRLATSVAEARCDPLTGLPNRRAFDEYLERMIGAGTEESQQVSVALFDLDDFKLVNDREGHLVGDRVLCEVGRVVLRNMRPEEEAFRIGGEELAVVVQGDADAAAHVADRIRLALLRQRRGHRLPTISAGVAGFPDDGQTKDELLHHADVALYLAKRRGKNRVEPYRASFESGASVGLAEAPSVHLARLPAAFRRDDQKLRVLLVDDDEGLRALVRTTLDVLDIEAEEAASTREAGEKLAARRPDVIVLDVSMPGVDGLAFCIRLKADPATAGIGVVLLTGAEGGTHRAAQAAGADAFLRKPFSPLELLGAVERVAGGLYDGALRAGSEVPADEQLLLYAKDLRRLLEIERGQRSLLENAYRETMTALAAALETKDLGTGEHSQRVLRYATELAAAIEPQLLDDPSVEFGFLLHDVGKIGIPDRVLQKRARLTPPERRVMETHTLLGEQMLGGVALLQGEGLKVVRSHHERWDGTGYPDGIAGPTIPLGARIFAVADSLDAMTSDRPYRTAGSWEAAVSEISAQANRHFDPGVVKVFLDRQARLRRVHYELTTAA